MTKQKQVTIKMDVRSAAAVRQVLFEQQRGYGLEYVPERVLELREVIRNLDEKIGEVVEE